MPRKHAVPEKPAESRKRAALYLRVSTDEQTTDNQRPDLEQIARARGLEIVKVYEEQGSAAKKRPAYDAMLVDAHSGQFDVLVIWALDRFGRSMVGNLNALLELDQRGVLVVSSRESWLDTSGPMRSLLIAIFSWVAEQERTRLIERTKAGMARVRKAGARVGAVPFGSKLAADGEHRLECERAGCRGCLHLEPNSAEKAVISRVRTLHQRGMSGYAVTRELEASGVRSRGGKPLSRAQVSRILRRA